jgi:hypothetical protein
MNKKNIFKKIILGSLIFFLILPLFVHQVKAFETPNPTYQLQFEEAISSGEMNLQSFVNETLKAIMGSFFHLFIGTFKKDCSITNPSSCLSQGEGQSLGLIPATSLVIAGLYSNPPASGISYFADLGRKIGIVRPALAQENFNSFTAMKMLEPIWTTFRNVSYLLLILILIAMGFAIMFRMKISPQAVITFQSALPRIVLALILITFSYAIVGLILDASMFLNSVIAGIFKSALGKNVGWAFNFSETISAMLSPNQVHSLVAPFADVFVYQQLGAVSMLIAILATSWLIIPLLGGLIVAILLAIAYLKALWTLLKAFAMIVVNLVFAPLIILVGVLPGTNGITSWFKNIIANVAVLPTMMAIMFLGNYLIILGTMEMGTLQTTNFRIEGFGIYAGFWLLSAMLFPLIGIFILLMIPKAADIIQSAITKKPFQYGAAIGEAFGPVTGPVKGAYQTVRGGIEKKQQAEVGEFYDRKIAPLRDRFFRRPTGGTGGGGGGEGEGPVDVG